MNKIFRRIFNAARGKIVAVEETKASHSQANAKGEATIGGGKPLVFAVVSAISAAGAGIAQAAVEEPEWDQAATSAQVKVNATGDQKSAAYYQRAGQSYSWSADPNKNIMYVYGYTGDKGDDETWGGLGSAGLLSMGGSTVELLKGSTIYVDSSRGGLFNGHATGLSVGYTSNGVAVNNGTIYVRGATFGLDKAKGINVDDGKGTNNGLIAVWDGYGMVSSSQGDKVANRLENAGSIEVNGGAAMVDNKGGAGSQVQIRNDGTIDVSEGTGILVSADSTEGTTYITNAGTINAAGQTAIDVKTSSHWVKVTLTGEDSSTIGTVRIADTGAKNPKNQTTLEVVNAGEQSVDLDAKYLDQLLVNNSSLSITNAQDELTINGIDLKNGSSFAVSEAEDDLTLIINDLTKDETSSVDFSNANVEFHQDWNVALGETKNFEDLFVGDEDAATNIKFTNEGFTFVKGDLGVGNNDAFTNIGSKYPLGGVVTAHSLTLTSGAIFNNSGTVNISGVATFNDGSKFNNAYNGTAGSFTATKLINNSSSFVNEGVLTVSEESQINGGFRNENEATLKGLTTIAQGGTIYNNGDLTLSSVVGSVDSEEAPAQLINALNKTLTFTANADVDAKISNSGALVFEDSSVISNNVANYINGTLTSTNLTVLGKLDNQSTATHNGTLTLNGTMINSGTEIGTDATLSMGTGSNTPFYTNESTANWGRVDITSGVWTNEAEADFSAGELNVGTENTNTWTMLVAANNGELNVQEINIQKAVLSNGSETGVINAGEVNIGTNGQLVNNNKLQVEQSITVTEAGMLDNADGASVNAVGLTLWNGSLDNRGTINVKALQTWDADFTNTGTLNVATDFTFRSGNITNEGTFNAGSANSQLGTDTRLTNEKEMSLGVVNFESNAHIINAEGASLKLNGNLSGEFDATVENAGTLELGSIAINDIDVNNTNQLISNGNVTLGSTLVNRGTADFNGLLTLDDGSYFRNHGTADVEMLDFKAGASITNAGTISGTAARPSFQNVTYEEVGADAEFNVGNIAFYHSTIKLTDGAAWDKTNGGSLGVANDYILSSNFAQENFDSTLLRDWRDGFSILAVDEVNGANSFELNKGGLLVADTIGNFSGGGYTGKITFNGGALETGLDQVFGDIAYVDGITGSVITDSSVVGELIAANTVGDVTENAQNAFVVGEEGGHVVFNDKYISTDLVAAVSNAFEAQEGWHNLTAHYSGELDAAIVTDVNWANSLTNQINSSVVLGKVSLIAQQPKLDDGMFDMVDGTLVMDGANAQGTTALGVGNIVFAEGASEEVLVQNGAHLTLVGFGEDQSMVGDNGTVTVDGDSLLTLGWNAGTLAEVHATNGGQLEVENGVYTVGSITGDGYVLNKGQLETGALQAQQFINNGSAYVTGDAAVGNFANNSGQVIVDGALTATEGLSNEAGAALSAGTLNAFELRNNGMVVVVDDASIDGEISNGLIEDADEAFVYVGGNLKAEQISNGAFIQIDGTANVSKIENTAGLIQLGSLISDEVNNKGIVVVDGQAEVLKTLSNAESSLIQVSGDLTAGTIDNDGIVFVNGTIGADVIDNAANSTVAAGNVEAGEVTNNGNLSAAEGYIKADSITNNDTLAAGSLEVVATFTNEGMASVVNDASVSGKLTNSSGAELIVGGDATIATLMNSGDLTVAGNAVVNGVADNQKTMIVGQKLTTNDVFFNHADAELTVVGDADLNGAFANQGNAVISGAATVSQVVNAGEATLAVGGNLTVEESFDNQNVLTVYGGLNVDGKLTNSGKTYVDGAVTLDGTLTQTEGEFLALGGETGNVINGTINVTGGKFMLGDTTTAVGAVISASNGATAQMVAADDKLSGRINVDGATFTLGNALPDTLSNVDEPQHEASSIFNMNQQAVDLGAEGIIAVGNGAKDVELTGGSVWFGSDSLLALNTSTYDGDSGFFKGEGSFVVEDGAQIQVSDASIGWGTYTLVSEGFKDVDLAEGGWLEHENIIYTGDKDIDLTIRENEDGNVEITIGSNNILDKLPDVAIPNLVNEVIADPHRSPNESGVKGFLAGAIENGILSENLQAETINDTAQIMAAGGVLVQGMTLVGNVMDITDRHLSYEDVHFKNGQLQRFDGVRLWADMLGQRVDASGYDFSGSSAEFDGYNAGFIFGADLMASCDARYGAAFAYQNASIDSNGSAVKTSNEADAYTFALYAAKTFGNFNFIGSLAYTRIDSDLEQTLPGALGAKQGKHEMDVSNDIYTLGLKGEYNISLSKTTQMVPYVGVRAVWMDTSDEKSKMGGSSAFDYDTDSITQVQFPIGVAFQGTTETKSGWTGRGVIDLSVTPVAGDKDVDTTISANGLTAQDVVNTEFADDLTGAIRIGISAEKDNMSFGGNLGFSTGGSRDGNVTFGLNARYRF